jgi:hypothetical protein
MAHAWHRTICWTPIWNKDREGVGLEHLLLSERAADGVVLAFDEEEGPFRLAYRLTWDDAWRLRDADLAVVTERSARSLGLRSDGRGRWRDGEGRALEELDGCVDVDIWPTPFTNSSAGPRRTPPAPRPAARRPGAARRGSSAWRGSSRRP